MVYQSHHPTEDELTAGSGHSPDRPGAKSVQQARISYRSWCSSGRCNDKVPLCRGTSGDLSAKSEYNGSPLTVNHEGMLRADNKLTGTASVPEYSVEGEFTATQAK
jgi:hypothetical protein